MEFNHYPVMLKENIEALNCKPDKLYIDCTLGGGSYSLEILKAISPTGRLIATDVDLDAIKFSSEKLKDFDNITIVNKNYSELPSILKEMGIDGIDGGVVLDLGASYHQLTSDKKGFSFSYDSPLDMRYDPKINKTAYDIVNFYKEDELIKIFSEYGEERFSKTIAREIVKKRKEKKFETTKELGDFIKEIVPFKIGHIHPATRVFQAIRIEVNDELNNLKRSLEKIIPLLKKGARIVIVSFHSLEDKIVKQTFKYYSSDCNCKPTDMICNCPPKQLKIINKKPILASQEEIKINPPSRSAKLRIAEKL